MTKTTEFKRNRDAIWDVMFLVLASVVIVPALLVAALHVVAVLAEYLGVL